MNEMKCLNVPGASEMEGVADNYDIKKSNKLWFPLVIIIASNYWILIVRYCTENFISIFSLNPYKGAIVCHIIKIRKLDTLAFGNRLSAQRLHSHPL